MPHTASSSSIPSTPGMRMSLTIGPANSRLSARNASAPSRASLTSYPASVSIWLNDARRSASSSTTITGPRDVTALLLPGAR